MWFVHFLEGEDHSLEGRADSQKKNEEKERIEKRKLRGNEGTLLMEHAWTVGKYSGLGTVKRTGRRSGRSTLIAFMYGGGPERGNERRRRQGVENLRGKIKVEQNSASR